MSGWNLEAIGKSVVGANLLADLNDGLKELGFKEGVTLEFDVESGQLRDAWLTPFPPEVDEKPKVRYRVTHKGSAGIPEEEAKRFDTWAEALLAAEQRSRDIGMGDARVFEFYEILETTD